MLELLGGLIDKEGMIRDTIINTFEDLLEEYNCTHNDLFVMIQPVNEDCNFMLFVYKMDNGVPKRVREITLKEILS